MCPFNLSKGRLAFRLTPSLLCTQASKAMFLHIQEHKEITREKAKPLAMALQRSTVGLAWERKPTALCVDA